jgi:hypothetical protein
MDFIGLIQAMATRVRRLESEVSRLTGVLQ